MPAALRTHEALAAGRFRLGRSPEARFDAHALLRHAAGHDAAWLLAHAGDVLDAATVAAYERALERRAAGEPVAYITGESWFYGRRFEVSPAVLAPRPETEQLLEAALTFLDERPKAARVCDAGTGSGILAVSLACERPQLELAALDLSPEALALARRNARAHGVAARIDFRDERSVRCAARGRTLRAASLRTCLTFAPAISLQLRTPPLSSPASRSTAAPTG